MLNLLFLTLCVYEFAIIRSLGTLSKHSITSANSSNRVELD